MFKPYPINGIHKFHKDTIDTFTLATVFQSKNNKELAISGSKYTFWINTNKHEGNDKTINLFSEHYPSFSV